MRDEAVIEYSVCEQVFVAEQHLGSKPFVKIQTEFRDCQQPVVQMNSSMTGDGLALVAGQNWAIVPEEKLKHII